MARRYNYESLEDAIENGEGEERPFQCAAHSDTNASASVNVLKGVWYCFTCHAAGRVDRKGTTLTAEMKRTVAALTVDQEVFYTESWLDWFDAYGPHPYWLERFGEDLCRKFRLGTHPMTMNPTYPFRDQHGKVQGVVQRTAWTPKYLYPVGVSAARSLFGYEHGDYQTYTVIVVEGAADVMAIHQACDNIDGLLSSVLVVGCYGAGLHAPQVQLINTLEPASVVLAFDNDEAGRRAAARHYPLNAAVTVLIWPQKDPGDSSAEEVRAVVRAVTAA